MKSRLLIAAVITLITFAACQKDNNTGRLQARLMDAPIAGNVQEVNIELIGAEAHLSGRGWINIPVQTGSYNLLQLVNGIDTLFVNADIPAGKLTQFRLKLGAANTIKVDNVIHPLIIPSGAESGLKVNVNEEIVDAATTVLFLDFDAGKSILLNGNGDYILRPVIRGFNAVQSGAITGSYGIPGHGIIVEAQTGSQVFTTYADHRTGHFMLRGLPPGSYTVRLYTASSTAAVSVSVVTVSANSLVDLGVL
jgi:Domain of unknown function (DUF4382)